ncbi:cdc42 homolog [Haliotis asinina]|uniref:cdc42 homolog n=1 Tax=Haliotis asinina TaxID=109174 RepID=UPI003531F595
MAADKQYTVTCTAVGDGGVGKTCLMLTFLTGKYPESYLPGSMDWHNEFAHVTREPVKFEYEGTSVSLNLVDTVGLDEYQKLREKVCHNTDVYMVCYDVTNPSSLDRVEHHWVPEIRDYSPSAPFLLVGTKTDARNTITKDADPKCRSIPAEEGIRRAEELGAFGYVECSAKSSVGLRRVFESAALAYMDNYVPSDTKKKSCVIS